MPDPEAKLSDLPRQLLDLIIISMEAFAINPFIKRSVVEQREGKWVLLTKDRSRVLGTHDTPSEAYGQEYAIQRSQKSRLQELLGAKGHSDKRQYRKKHEVLRRLMSDAPQDFIQDSAQGNIRGITHTPSGFRIHMPVQEFPPNFPLAPRSKKDDTMPMTKSAFIKQAMVVKTIAAATKPAKTLASEMRKVKPVDAKIVNPNPSWAYKNRFPLTVAGTGAAAWGAGNLRGHSRGYDSGQEQGFGMGQDIGKQMGYGLAANQAQNTGIFSRIMGNYDFNPQALSGMGVPAPATNDLFAQAAANDPNKLGLIRRSLGI